MSILVILVVAGYIGFELFALQRTKYRTEPLYIFDQFLLAHHAVTKCGSPEAGRLVQFRRNLRSVAARAARELAESSPESSPEQIEQMISARNAEREREVEAIVRAQGCDGPEIKTLLKRFEIRARLRVG
jgi:hypothetical protein